MRYFLLLFLITNTLFAAKVNKLLYSETNATAEIHKVRKMVSDNASTDPEVQNQISAQKLFLSKLETLATIVPQPTIVPYKLPNQKKLTKREFFNYVNYVAVNLNKMQIRTVSGKELRIRLVSLSKQLEDLDPKDKNKILQAQLEYAYFKWKEIFNKRKLKDYHQFLEDEKKRFLHAFEITHVNIDTVTKKLKKFNKKIQDIYQKKIYLELSIEKETILVASKKTVDINADINNTKLISALGDKEKNWKYNFLIEELTKLNKQLSIKIKERNEQFFLMQIDNLQKEDLDHYIIVRKQMNAGFPDLSSDDQAMFTLEQKMLEWLKYQHIGDLTAIFYDFKAWSQNAAEHVSKFVNEPILYLQDKPIIIADFLRLFFTIILGFFLAKFYKRRVIAAQGRISFIQEQSFKIIGNLGYYFIVIITFVVALHNFGLDLSSLSLVAGALSVGIGFGLKEVVGNFVSGIILMAERSAKIGDFVEIDNTIIGNITDIRMRSVTIKTSANIDIVVPNSDLVQKSFVNYTLEEPVRRLSIPFTVAYGVSYETVNELIMKALADSKLTYIRDSKEFETEVIMTGMDERGVNYTLFVFVKTYQTSARSSYFRLIYKTLNDNNLPIPAPRLDVSMNEVN